MEQFGVDIMTEPVDSDIMITIPDIECPLSIQCLERLKELVDPLSVCSDYGIQFYLDVVAYVISSL